MLMMLKLDLGLGFRVGASFDNVEFRFERWYGLGFQGIRV